MSEVVYVGEHLYLSYVVSGIFNVQCIKGRLRNISLVDLEEGNNRKEQEVNHDMNHLYK